MTAKDGRGDQCPRLGNGRALAYGSLLLDGFNVRMSGEDCERGTFSHRHAVIKAEDSEEEVMLLNGMRKTRGAWPYTTATFLKSTA